MLELGGRPILWHIMKLYSHYGIHDDSVICLGYTIKDYSAFRHGGFFHSVDTMRDKIDLDELWSSGRAPWRVWP